MLIGVSAYPNPATNKLYKNLVQDNKLADYFRVNDEIFLLLLIIKGEALILKDLLILGVNLLHRQRVASFIGVMQHSELLVELFNVLYRSTINKKVRFHKIVQLLLSLIHISEPT